MHENAAKIQRAFRTFVFRCTVLEGLAWRKRIKTLLINVVEAWSTRRALNCLGSEVQEYVNCDDSYKKAKLRIQFHDLFDQVLSSKLYLESNGEKLKRLINARHHNSAPVTSQNSMRESYNKGSQQEKTHANKTAASHGGKSTERSRAKGPSTSSKSKVAQPPSAQQPVKVKTQRNKAAELSQPEKS